MKHNDFRFTVDSYVAGIPCKLGVTEVGYVPESYTRGHPDHWEDAVAELHTYEILERKGYAAPWLVNKCSAADERKHQTHIDNYLKDI
jgi:hypothetical protein